MGKALGHLDDRAFRSAALAAMMSSRRSASGKHESSRRGGATGGGLAGSPRARACRFPVLRTHLPSLPVGSLAKPIGRHELANASKIETAGKAHPVVRDCASMNAGIHKIGQANEFMISSST